ncbi:hypothetical protein [Laspinema palackyanum]|uniref:hypothetical protein n=1 Tax=Laspinema palackyanum TaxID=3231601 RepID=UPI00345C906B|nr:hypothetical protein [Laspinema sp. D2c]
MAKKITSKSTKAEIMEAFEELEKENSGLEAQVKQLAKEKQAAAKSTISAVKEVNSPEVKTPMNTTPTAQQKINQTIESLQLLQFGFGGAVSDLSERLTGEAAKLHELDKSVNQEVEDLQNLHDLEVSEETLEGLVQTYQERAKTFQGEITDRQDTLEQQIQTLKKTWEKEQETHQREIKERNTTRQKQQQRDAEEYRYSLERDRHLAQEEYAQTQKGLYQELAEIRQTQEQEWTERENAIAEREKYYAEAKAKVEAHPKELETNIKNGKDSGRNIGNYQAKIASDLRSKEVEGLQRSYQLQISALEVSINNQEERIKTLTKQLESALKQVQDLAVKAIEGTSNANSFQALREIAVEQAKNLPKSK